MGSCGDPFVSFFTPGDGEGRQDFGTIPVRKPSGNVL